MNISSVAGEVNSQGKLSVPPDCKIMALTSYYNPFKGAHRRLNYEVFRAHLGMPLMTVEWSPVGDFELGAGDADFVVQIAGGDIVWQKERLLNIGLKRLKLHGCDVAFLVDSDIIFPCPGWYKEVLSALEGNAVAQCFERVKYLPPLQYEGMSRGQFADVAPEHEIPSFARMIRDRDSDPERLKSSNASGFQVIRNPGLAVALRMDRGIELYEANLVGGADGILAATLTGHLEKYMHARGLSDSYRQHILAWAAPYMGLGLACAANDVVHLWHGRLEDRKYIERFNILRLHDYDPFRDLVGGTQGALMLSPEAEKLRLAVRDYLASRKDS